MYHGCKRTMSEENKIEASVEIYPLYFIIQKYMLLFVVEQCTLYTSWGGGGGAKKKNYFAFQFFMGGPALKRAEKIAFPI